MATPSRSGLASSPPSPAPLRRVLMVDREPQIHRLIALLLGDEYQVDGARRMATLNIGGSFTTVVSFVVEVGTGDS